MAQTAEVLRVFGAAKEYEQRLSRLLIAFLASGLVFLLGPGSLLGFSNLWAISRHEAVRAVGAAWLQAHGQAEVYGWVGSFILGIGFHSLSRSGAGRISLPWAWTCWALWSLGVASHWAAGVYEWQWRILLPLGAAMELAAFAIFQSAIAGAHRPNPGARREPQPGWVVLVLTGALGFGLGLAFGFGSSLWTAMQAASPALPPALDSRLVVLLTWSFLAPFIFGFSMRWFPIFAGLPPARDCAARVLPAIVLAGTLLALAGLARIAALVFLCLAVAASVSLAVFRPARQSAKTQGIHKSFPFFLRGAYMWLIIAAALGVWAAFDPAATGAGGAGRHAFTVGFVAGMVLTIGPRILPAFSGMKALYSPRLMFLSLLLLETGCSMRVSGEVLAYANWLPLAWQWLPLSAGLEVAAFTLFAYNLARTLLRPPEHLRLRAQPA